MIKVISSLVSGEKLELAENAGRAPYFIVFENDKYIKTIKNPFTVGGGAGIAVAELLKDEKCDVFIAKKVGEKMQSSLDSFGIKVKNSL